MITTVTLYVLDEVNYWLYTNKQNKRHIFGNFGKMTRSNLLRAWNANKFSIMDLPCHIMKRHICVFHR